MVSFVKRFEELTSVYIPWLPEELVSADRIEFLSTVGSVGSLTLTSMSLLDLLNQHPPLLSKIKELTLIYPGSLLCLSVINSVKFWENISHLQQL